MSRIERLAAVVLAVIPLATAIVECDKNETASAALAGYYVPALAECIAKEK